MATSSLDHDQCRLPLHFSLERVKETSGGELPGGVPRWSRGEGESLTASSGPHDGETHVNPSAFPEVPTKERLLGGFGLRAHHGHGPTSTTIPARRTLGYGCSKGSTVCVPLAVEEYARWDKDPSDSKPSKSRSVCIGVAVCVGYSGGDVSSSGSPSETSLSESRG